MENIRQIIELCISGGLKREGGISNFDSEGRGLLERGLNREGSSKELDGNQHRVSSSSRQCCPIAAVDLFPNVSG